MTYLQYGLSNELATKLDAIGIPKTTLSKTSKKNLRERYGLTENEVDIAKEAIIRTPIEQDLLDLLLEHSNYTCCICKGVKSKSYIIHHIEEYHISQDNSYQNLAVLCLDDHDLAHKTGRSLTSKLSADQVRNSKYKWQLEVQQINIQRAAKNGNITEIDFLNIPRIIELYIELFKSIPSSQYSKILISKNLITECGEINQKQIEKVNNKPNTPLIFFAPLGSSMLRFHYYEVFEKILNHLNFKDLDSLLNKTSIRKGILGEYCFYVGGLYSSKLPTAITSECESMIFHLRKRKIIVEWLVDPKYFCSSSAKYRTSQRNIYMIFGKIRNIDTREIEGEKYVTIDIRPYCFGLPDLVKHRTPDISFRNQIDELLDDD